MVKHTELPFLTDLDSRAAIKGSRDPLGIQSIWSGFGRRVVSNLTTVSSSVRDFAVLLLGHYFADRAEQEDGKGPPRLDIFLRWEQLAAYIRRGLNNEDGFRGIERVMRHLQESRIVIISAERRHQILSNQRTYGLWGLYSSPARASGLLTEETAQLTPEAARFVESEYIQGLDSNGKRYLDGLLKLLASGVDERIALDGKHQNLAKALAGILSKRMTKEAAEFYRERLLCCPAANEVGRIQPRLAEVIEAVIASEPANGLLELSVFTHRKLVEVAKKQGVVGQELRQKLLNIGTIERLIAPVSRIFGWLLAKDGEAIGPVAEELKKHFGGSLRRIDTAAIDSLGHEFERFTGGMGSSWSDLARMLQAEDFQGAVRLMIGMNGEVLKRRGSDAWIGLRSGRLAVRLRDEQGSLPSRQDVPRLWIFPYFINSMLAIAQTLKEAQ